jgi:hypothetical protein
MITEFGYSSNPPNPYRGIPLTEQAAWINEADYLAWRQPRVASVAQFLLRDSPPKYTAKKGTFSYWSTFQTGLAYLNGNQKPSYNAYAMPIWIHSGHNAHGRRELRLWAQVRFSRYAPGTTGPAQYVAFEFKPRGAKQYRQVTKGLSPSPGGFVSTIQSAAPYAQGGTFQAWWIGPSIPFFFASRTAAFP